MDNIYKERTVPLELQKLRCLVQRSDISASTENNYENLEQGYRGECLLDRWLETLPKDVIVLNDLLLEHSGTMFQIDSLIITQGKIIPLEVKNYQGDYCLEGERMLTRSGNEVKNPLVQLRRCESQLRQFLQPLRLNLEIKSYLIFINPDFFLYNTQPDMPIIFHSQLKRFFAELSMNNLRLNRSHEKLAKHFITHHINESPYQRTPDYDPSKLRKGFICHKCDHSKFTHSKGYVMCTTCNDKEKIDAAVLRMIKEYRLLFPNSKLTTSAIYDWCEILHKKVIRRILLNNYKRIGEGKDAYYENK